MNKKGTTNNQTIKGITLFSALLTLVSSLSFSLSSIKNIKAWEVITYDKTIYVDLSLNLEQDETTEGCAFQYEDPDKEVVKVPLAYLDNGIFQTSEEIPLFNGSSPNRFGIYQEDNGTLVQDLWFSDWSPLLKDNYNYVCLDLDSSNEEAVCFGYYGHKIKDNLDATAATQRVWLRNENQAFYDLDPWDTPYQNAVYYECGEDDYGYTIMAKTTNTFDNRNYYYADIPKEVRNISFLRMSSSESHDFIIDSEAPIVMATYGLCYEANPMIDKDWDEINTVNVSDADAYLLGKVVEAYLTYGKEASNGADSTTIINLFNTWFKNKSASSEDLKNVKILDYGGDAYINGEYNPDVPKSGVYSVNEKWSTICSIAGIDPKTGEKRSFNIDFSFFGNKAFLSFLVIFLFGLLGIGGWLFMILRRRRLRAKES